MSDVAHITEGLPPSLTAGPLNDLAAETIKRSLDELTSAIAGAKTSRHIERVHRMRVSSRRLRTSLGIFEGCFGRRKAKAWRTSLQRLGRSLGDVRDLDVQSEFLEEFMKEHTDRTIHPGLERLLLRLTQRRDRRQRRLRRVLDRFEHADVLSEIGHASENVCLRDPAPTRELAAEMINARLDDMLALEPCLDDYQNVEALHEVRIAAKHLRYTLEVFEPLLGEQARQPLDHLRQIQKILGDLHDCDVWIEFLPRFIEKEKKRTRRFLGHTKGFKRIARGLLHLQEQRIRSRQDIYMALIEFWAQCRREGTWGTIRRIASNEIELLSIGAGVEEPSRSV
jgi:CHAD domain-containing protein